MTVNVKSKLNSNEPFSLASQATQVYYTRSVKTSNSSCYVNITTKARGFQSTTPRLDDEPLQVEFTSVTPTDVTIISESSEDENDVVAVESEDDIVSVESEDDVVEEEDINEKIIENDKDGDDNRATV